MSSARSGRASLDADLTLDARRAAFFPRAGVLAVADLHLGYAWAQRTRGALLPLGGPDLTASRLAALVSEYSPRRVAVLGDVIHRAVALPALEESLRGLCAALAGTELVFCPGNHDRRLDALVRDWKLPVTLAPQLDLGRHRLWHGDDAIHPEPPGKADFALEGEVKVQVIGHEHPALELGDGIATRAKVPCFLVADEAIVLPAFTDWAAGCVVGRRPFLGAAARAAKFHTAFACLGPRLLRMPLPD